MHDLYAARTFASLEDEVTARSLPEGNMETVAHTLYDTEVYTTAVTTQLRFFRSARASRQLTNMETPGQLPHPQFFRIVGFEADVIVPPAARAADPWLDLHRIIYGGTVAGEGAPSALFDLASKTYGPWEFSRFHATGGVQGFGFEAAPTTGAAGSVAYANNSWPDGGWCVHGTILIPPQQGFGTTISYDNAQTINVDHRVRHALNGVWYRRIL